MSALDLSILRQMAEARRPSTAFDPKTVLALLDRIAELEQLLAAEQQHGPTCTPENEKASLAEAWKQAASIYSDHVAMLAEALKPFHYEICGLLDANNRRPCDCGGMEG